MQEEEESQIHHRVRRVDGGEDGLDNLELLHANCHRQIHSREEEALATAPPYPTEGGRGVDCGRYQELYEQFTAFPLPREVWDSAEYESWQTHGFDCHSCGEWDLLKQVQERGVSLEDAARRCR